VLFLPKITLASRLIKAPSSRVAFHSFECRPLTSAALYK
jgi:hypothetical protein